MLEEFSQLFFLIFKSFLGQILLYYLELLCYNFDMVKL